MKKFLPKTSKNPQGFTLVELLVVVSIIAILAVIGFVVLGNVTNNARDARRKADVDSISKAYEVNYNFGTGKYQALVDSQFTTGKKPTPPEGGNYICVKGPTSDCTTNSTKEFLVCANLEGGVLADCKATTDTCYCKSAAHK